MRHSSTLARFARLPLALLLLVSPLAAATMTTGSNSSRLTWGDVTQGGGVSTATNAASGAFDRQYLETEVDVAGYWSLGGGLEYGEGTIDCLHREAMEEMGLEIDITGHFYTTDFFQQALFYENTQLISIYYKATLKEPHLLKTSTKKHDFDMKEGSQSFRWVNVQTLSTSELSFPIDQKVLQLLQDGIRIKIGVDQSL